MLRKGRENYLCLLNLEEASRAVAAAPQYAPALGLMARWAAATRDGDDDRRATSPAGCPT